MASAVADVDQSLVQHRADGSMGVHRITIHVFPSTTTFNRGGFFIHGGTHPGSAGCINLHGQMENFVRELQDEVKADPDCYIPLKVQYLK
ncbi:DUF2778 domain-containing protein [Paraburkholderia dipogonis]|uniref:DUF2778 domain-containing protein n=1 Tax=Paraburkholderia dipogonis TaxID=1211383 RepID=UPI001FCB4845|nr:DUF2778 domain-containing protein [Paraburkholderia dipogonis]